MECWGGGGGGWFQDAPKVVQGTTLMYIRPTNDFRVSCLLHDE